MPARTGGFAVAIAVACGLSGCRGTHGTSADSDAGPTDGVLARESGASLTLDAGPADDAIPPATSEDLTARARHLLEAIANDNAELATDILFPRDGWLATRDATEPGTDWEKHVATPFRKALHKLSKKSSDFARAQFVSMELGHAVVQATPKRHRWKKALWTVRGSRLAFVVDGHTRTLSIREMTAWRGAWYVTLLR